MDHTVSPANYITPCLPLPRKRSPDSASPDWGCGHFIAAYYSFIYPERMKGWAGLVGWPIAHGWPTCMVTNKLEVERRTGKVRKSKTNVLPLRHAAWWHTGDVAAKSPVVSRHVGERKEGGRQGRGGHTSAAGRFSLECRRRRQRRRIRM